MKLNKNNSYCDYVRVYQHDKKLIGFTITDNDDTVYVKLEDFDTPHKRPSWDDTFMTIARDVSERSTCLRRKVGAIVVQNNERTEIGYNGSPKKTQHCTDIGYCLRDKLNIPSGQRHEICRGAHGDGNAIARAGKEKCQGATLYIYGGTPCGYCAKLAINNGISRIVCCGNYPDDLALELLREANIIVDKYEFTAK